MKRLSKKTLVSEMEHTRLKKLKSKKPRQEGKLALRREVEDYTSLPLAEVA